MCGGPVPGFQEHMAGDAGAGIDIGGVALMRLSRRARQAVRFRRLKQQVNVVGHEAIGEANNAMHLAAFGHQIPVKRIIPRSRAPETAFAAGCHFE